LGIKGGAGGGGQGEGRGAGVRACGGKAGPVVAAAGGAWPFFTRSRGLPMRAAGRGGAGLAM
jgi:hypothetical protein